MLKINVTGIEEVKRMIEENRVKIPGHNLNHNFGSSFYYGPDETGKYKDDPSKAILSAEEGDDGVFRVNDLESPPLPNLPGFDPEEKRREILKTISKIKRAIFLGGL